MRNTKWYAAAMLVVTAGLGAMILLPRPEKAHAISPETCFNGTNLESATINWFAGQAGGNQGHVIACAEDPSFPPTHGGSCKSTYGIICANNDGGTAHLPYYRIELGELCLGDASHRKLVSNLQFKTSAGAGWTLIPFPQDTMHCTCNAGGSGATCNWQ